MRLGQQIISLLEVELLLHLGKFLRGDFLHSLFFALDFFKSEKLFALRLVQLGDDVLDGSFVTRNDNMFNCVDTSIGYFDNFVKCGK